MTPSVDNAGARLAQAAVAAVAAWLGRRGQWPGELVAEAGDVPDQPDMAAPLTALGILALLDLPVPGAAEVVDRSRDHVANTVLPNGLWRYYANIPPDTDDSAMCVLALGRDHPVVRERDCVAALASTRRPDGLFPTWLEPGWAPVVEPVPNAHVVAAIGPDPTTDAAVAWLLDVVDHGTEVTHSVYYRDPLDLHVALTRAVDAGVEDLAAAVQVAATRAAERLAAVCDTPAEPMARQPLTAYRIAQAMVVAARDRRPDRALLTRAADVLAGQRCGLAAWPADTLYSAGRTDGAGLMHYRSAAVVTALCARALVAAAG